MDQMGESCSLLLVRANVMLASMVDAMAPMLAILAHCRLSMAP